MAKISTRDFRSVCEIIFRNMCVDKIDFSLIGYYWTIAYEDAFEGGSEVLADTFEDLECLAEIVSGESVIWNFHVEHLGSLIESVSFVLEKQRKDKDEKSNSMTVYARDLLKACRVIVKRIERNRTSTIEINVDEYISINMDDAYNAVQFPETYTGSIKEDWKRLEELLNIRSVPDTNDLRVIGRLLKGIGYSGYSFSPYWFVHARVLCETEEDVARLETLQKLLEKDTKDVKALIELGFLYFDAFHEPEKAKNVLEKALKIEPENTKAMFWLAETLYHDFFDKETAVKLIKKAISLEPESALLHEFLSQILYERGKDPSKAFFHKNKAIELEPSWMKPRIDLCYLLLEVKRKEESKKVYEDAKKAFECVRFTKSKSRMDDFLDECIRGEKGYVEETLGFLDKRFSKG
ncbi:tetratricopeptide repeat protein [Candidatus Dependentiae bacterium]